MNAIGRLVQNLHRNLFLGVIDSVVLWFGLAMFAGGIVMMFLHLRQWQRIDRSDAEPRTHRHEWRKFRRRTLVGALFAACGAICTSLSRPLDPLTYISLVTALIILLLLVLLLGLVDLASVGLFQFSKRDDQKLHRAMIEDLLRRHREKQAQAAEASRQDGS